MSGLICRLRAGPRGPTFRNAIEVGPGKRRLVRCSRGSGALVFTKTYSWHLQRDAHSGPNATMAPRLC